MVRGIAASLVVVCHLKEILFTYTKHTNSFYTLIGSWGTEAVIIFFVLSGIVIHASVEKYSRKPWQFILERILRIHPILFIAVALSYFTEIIVFNFYANSKLIIGNLIPVSTLAGSLSSVFPNANPVIWSLSFEIFFYVIFAVFVLSFRKARNISMCIWFAISVISLFIPYLIAIKSSFISYLINMLAFSGIWIIGYFIWHIRNTLVTSVPLALISLACLPMLSRLHLNSDYYDPVRYTIFALTSIPFFVFLIKGSDSKEPKSYFYKYYSEAIIAFALLISIPILAIDNSYPTESKIIYISLPILTLVLSRLRTVKKIISIIYTKLITPIFYKLGSISYSIYLIHFPILMLIFHKLALRIYWQVSLFLISTYFISSFLEKVLQPYLNKTLKPKY